VGIRITTSCACGWSIPDVVIDSPRREPLPFEAYEQVAECQAAIAAHVDKRHVRASGFVFTNRIEPEGDSDA